MGNIKYNFDVSFIKSQVLLGKKAKELADHYGCSTSSIYALCKRNKIDFPKVDLVGKRFNKFVVLKKLGSRGDCGKQSIYWKCLCECGNTREFPTKSINRKEYVSCGCYLRSKERSRNNHLWNGYGDIHGKWWNNIIKGARRRSHEFKLDIKYAWNLYLRQNKQCKLSGVDIVFAETSRGFQNGYTTASLDRIDNFKGYIKGNVQWVHKDVNLMKQKMSQQELIKWCKLIAKHRD
jgi:hypothetical protein